MIQIERLLQKTKEKLAAKPLMASAAIQPPNGLQRGDSGRNRRPLDPHLESYLNRAQQQQQQQPGTSQYNGHWQQQHQMSPPPMNEDSLSHLKYVPGNCPPPPPHHQQQQHHHAESSDEEDTLDNRYHS